MRILVIFLLSLSISTLSAQEKESAIAFINNDLAKAFEEAENKNQIVFVDAYTTWCGPCKMMDQNVFSDPDVASLFNSRFVNLKLDMEKGEGPAAAKKYEVRGYPSFLFLSADGTLLHRGIGYLPKEQFLKLAAQAENPDLQLPKLDDAYQNGSRDPELLYNYSNALSATGNPKSLEVGAAYLETQDSWTSRKNLEMVAQMAQQYKDPYYNYLVEKRHLFVKEFGEDRVDGTIVRFIQSDLFSQLDGLNMEEAKTIFVNTFPKSKSDKLFRQFQIDYFAAIGNKEKYIENSIDFVKKYPDLGANQLNSLAWDFYENTDDPKALKKAIKWAKKSISYESAYFNNDTLAALYFKIGNKKKALKYATAAIELAKEAEMDYSETTTLLEKIVQL